MQVAHVLNPIQIGSSWLPRLWRQENSDALRIEHAIFREAQPNCEPSRDKVAHRKLAGQQLKTTIKHDSETYRQSSFVIRSAKTMESWIAELSAGFGRVLSSWASFRIARKGRREFVFLVIFRAA